MGTPDFAVESLQKLYEAGHTIMAVVSQPDKPVGRGMKYMPTPTKAFALEKGIPIYQPEKIKKNEEFMQEIKALSPDVIVVVAYGKILPMEILEIPKFGCINVHGSLLPKYRGAAPIQWAIINGEKETGVTTMYMARGMDSGDMLLKEAISIESQDTYGTLYEKLKILGGKLIVKTLDGLEKGTLTREAQSEEFTLAPMIFRENCKIDWKQSANAICNLVRGVNPVPGAWTTLDGNTYKIWSCEEISITEKSVVENLTIKNLAVKNSLVEEMNVEGIEAKIVNVEKTKSEMLKQPGTIIMADSKKGLWIATGQGILSVKEIQAPNAKRMNILDYLRGKSMAEGNVMGE